MDNTWEGRGLSGCIVHGGTDKDHYAKGMCRPCYERDRRRIREEEAGPGMSPGGAVDRPPVAASGVDADPSTEAAEDLIIGTTPGERRPGEPAGHRAESPPTGESAGSPGRRRKWWQRKSPGSAVGGSPPPADARMSQRPARRTVKRRIDASDTLGDLYGAAGGLVARSRPHLAPVARMTAFQAPVAGIMLDDAVAGTFVDRIAVQPAVAARGRLDAVAAVFGPPVLVGMMCQHPDRFQTLLPILKSQIRSSLPLMVPAIKKAEKKAQEAAAAAEELFGEPVPEGVDPVDQVIAMLFADWQPPAPPTPAPDGVDSDQSASVSEVHTP